MKTSQFTLLGEYRRNKLRVPQAEIARKAKVKQGWISQVELGHLPAPWNRDALLQAYELSEKEFVRMVANAARLQAIQIPIGDDMPLFAQGALNEAKQALQMQYEHKTGRALA